MKAARWVDVGRVVCEEAPLPSAADGEILLRTTYASICGSDLHSVFASAPPQPGIAGYPGHESVGEVVESRCPGFAPGDRVLTVPHFVDGRCMAEYQALPGSACIRLPDTAPLSHLLMAQQLGTVVYALRRHPLDLIGKDAAVIGQGSAGAFFTFLLKRAGAGRVLASDKSPARLAYSRRLGADITVHAGPMDAGPMDAGPLDAGPLDAGPTIDAGSLDAGTGDFRSAVLEATGGQGASLVVEAVGSLATFPLSLELAADGATVVWFGLPEGSAAYPFSFHEFFRRRLTAYSVFDAQGEPGLESFRYAVRLITDGAIDVAPLLSHMLPIDQVEQAFRIARERTGNALKVSVTF
jgi:L-iditol 2-dehydrogenase